MTKPQEQISKQERLRMAAEIVMGRKLLPGETVRIITPWKETPTQPRGKEPRKRD